MCPPDAHPVACHQVVVIGGGIAGLTAVKICQDHGIDAHAFEREINLGGVWNHTYKNVGLQQHKDDFRLSGTEWPANVKDFPDAKAVEAYVAKFVHEHNLACKVTAGVEVVSAERDEVADEWHVVLSDGRKARSKHLIVATGALGKPKQSEAAAAFENFSGEVLHSSEYYDAEQFHGKDVLIIGGILRHRDRRRPRPRRGLDHHVCPIGRRLGLPQARNVRTVAASVRRGGSARFGSARRREAHASL